MVRDGPAATPPSPPCAAIPIIVKIPVPTTAPIPKIIKSKAFKVFFNSECLLAEIN